MTYSGSICTSSPQFASGMHEYKYEERIVQTIILADLNFIRAKQKIGSIESLKTNYDMNKTLRENWIYKKKNLISISLFFSYFRPDTTPFSLYYFLKGRCRENLSCKKSLDLIDSPIDSIEDTKRRRNRQRIANATNFGVVLLRLRASVALFIGNYRQVIVGGKEVSPIFGLFRKALWIDVSLFWLTMMFCFWRQCRLCCQLGCVRYYCWAGLVFITGLLAMELPMHFVSNQLDVSWCSLEFKNVSIPICKVFPCIETVQELTNYTVLKLWAFVQTESTLCDQFMIISLGQLLDSCTKWRFLILHIKHL